jgi:hypothetical protein
MLYLPIFGAKWEQYLQTVIKIPKVETVGSPIETIISLM